MESSRILLILSCFLLLVCLALALTDLISLRNAVAEASALRADAEELLSCFSDLSDRFSEEIAVGKIR